MAEKLTKEQRGYDIEALKRNISKCDDNIRVFEKAIEEEEKSKRWMKGIVRQLEEIQAEKEDADNV